MVVFVFFTIILVYFQILLLMDLGFSFKILKFTCLSRKSIIIHFLFGKEMLYECRERDGKKETEGVKRERERESEIEKERECAGVCVSVCLCM